MVDDDPGSRSARVSPTSACRRAGAVDRRAAGAREPAGRQPRATRRRSRPPAGWSSRRSAPSSSRDERRRAPAHAAARRAAPRRPADRRHVGATSPSAAESTSTPVLGSRSHDTLVGHRPAAARAPVTSSPVGDDPRHRSGRPTSPRCDRRHGSFGCGRAHGSDWFARRARRTDRQARGRSAARSAGSGSDCPPAAFEHTAAMPERMASEGLVTGAIQITPGGRADRDARQPSDDRRLPGDRRRRPRRRPDRRPDPARLDDPLPPRLTDLPQICATCVPARNATISGRWWAGWRGVG